MRIAAVGLAVLAMNVSGARAQDFARAQDLVSVAQYQDVKPADAYFGALQSLVERYGVAHGYGQGKNAAFKGAAPLKRAEMIMMVAAAADQMQNLITASDAPPEKFKSLSIMQGAKCKASASPLSSAAQIIDVTPQQPYYDSVQSLVERWNVQLATKDGVFGAGDVVTVADAQSCLGLFAKQPLNHKPATLTRGDFAIMLNEALENFGAELAGLN